VEGLLVPDSTCLFEPIERFLELADIFWSTYLKSFRLLHVDLLLEFSIEICM
jgi:hypothetical protein